MYKTANARSYKDRPVMSELGHGLYSVGVARIIAMGNGEKPEGIFKSDKDKSCYMEKGMYIIDYNRVELKEQIFVYSVLDYGYDLELNRFILDLELKYDMENIPGFLKDAVYAARMRASIYGCDESMYMK